MRSLLALSLVLAAGCPAPTGDDLGPQEGRWRVDPAPNQGWFCARGGSVPCAPPSYFSPPPAEVEVRGGGVLAWAGGVQHTGALETACIRAPAASEQGLARTEVTFCNLIVDGVADEDRAFAIIGWSPGTADECTCSAHFDHLGD
jgi:hypothetical protein